MGSQPYQGLLYIRSMDATNFSAANLIVGEQTNSTRHSDYSDDHQDATGPIHRTPPANELLQQGN